MVLSNLDPDRLVANRNVCTGIAGVATAAVGLAYALQTPIAVRMALAAVAVIAALAVLGFYLLERHVKEIDVDAEARGVPRAEMKKPHKFVNRREPLLHLY